MNDLIIMILLKIIISWETRKSARHTLEGKENYVKNEYQRASIKKRVLVSEYVVVREYQWVSISKRISVSKH